MDAGTRKHGLAALLIGGAVAQHQWPYALAAFVIYVAANTFRGVRDEPSNAPKPDES